MERGSVQNTTPERLIYVPKLEPSHFIPNSITTCKYNFLTFLPKNLWFQFQKLANIYFLIIAVLQVIPQITVSDGVPNILLPLGFVLTVSAVKDLLEDLNRRKSDNEENNRQILKWQNSNWESLKWMDICVGDVVKVRKNEYFPADLILLSSSEPNGLCYIETKNLDGETNLKHKLCCRVLHDMLHDEGALDRFFAEIICEIPNPMIYEFKGKITAMDTEVMLGTEQFLLRGSSLRNTEWIIGIVVYSGHETKIMLNSSKSQNKFSFLEARMNDEIINIFILQVTICLFCALFYVIWFSHTSSDTEQYLELDEHTESRLVVFILIFFTWMLIFTNFVPISLIVTLEMVKFVQGIFISWDIKMYYEENDTPARVQSSNLNEELGQIHYIFSDKTGTLTCNIMEFRKFCINGTSYGTNKRQGPESKKPAVDFVDPSFDAFAEDYQEFLLHLALCHTIVTEKAENGEIEYKASSPDELALVSAAKFFGVELLGRNGNQEVIISVHGEEKAYQVLNILEFSSNRKRMSIVCRFPNGKLYLLCKGADTMLLPRLQRDQRNIEKSWEYLEAYASEGLRTLVLATRELSDDEYEAWNTEYLRAMGDIVNREKLVSQVNELLEKNLLLTGITAIEDKLQDGVPAAISFIREAGIKVWVLTGDKIETAINIGFSSALLTNEMSRAIIDGTSEYTVKFQLQEALSGNRFNASKFALIISGDSLLKILKSDLIFMFIKLIDKADVVLACRVSPQQKADLVRLIRDVKPNVRTLSIGDGANDVNMILAAHVGVGIAGLEGNQAVRAADYSIAQFAYLKRLLFTHGRECYRRNANLIGYNFYKNLLLTLPLFFYGIFSAFSGQILYSMWTYQLFNVWFASFPIMIYAIFDKDKEFHKLEQMPELYKIGLKDKLFHGIAFWSWIVEGVLESVVLTIVSVYSICYSSTESNGRIMGMWEVSDLIYSLVVIVCNLRVFGFSLTFYWFSVLISFLSVVMYFLTSAILTQWLPIETYLDNYDGRGSTAKILQVANTYFVIIIVCAGIFIIAPIIKYIKKIKKLLTPPPKYKEIPENDNEEQVEPDEDLPLSTYTPLLARKHTGFAFSGELGHTPQITDPSFRRQS
ncbi:hypothetical protein SteCoe_21684 [Stentor coeruleus]|uniref:Phospholipid-transporting ATPase n=1 Tax=Stentor coeruleus TaxID=5963 RepID=A0A1R2BP24_9CILI|nr:hypothetical protein SteCoe_21684 [Stentor coeruleus]